MFLLCDFDVVPTGIAVVYNTIGGQVNAKR